VLFFIYLKHMSNNWLLNTIAFFVQESVIFMIGINYNGSEVTGKFTSTNFLVVASETVVAVLVISIVAGFSFRRQELMARRDSLFNITAIAQMEQANVLDALPDAIFIANKNQTSYANNEGWDLLNCVTKREEVKNQKDLRDVKCIDRESGAEVSLNH
jgi:hypothetical protein